MDIKAIWTLIKSAATSWIDDYAPSMGAALAYYTVFSVAPLMLIVISIAGLVFGQEAASGEIFAQLSGLMGEDGAAAIQAAVESVNKPAESVIATIVGVVVLLIGATTVFGELQDSLDRIWRAPARESGGVWNLIRTRLLSFGMIMGIGFLLMVSLVISAGISALGNWWTPLFGGWEILANVVNLVFSFALVTSIFALIYKVMPRVHIAWHDVWIGSAVTALLFTVGKFVIGLYIGKSSIASGFGAAGSLVVVLVWVYYSSQIFLLGAEFTWVFAHTFGSRKGIERPAALSKPTAVPTRTDGAANAQADATLPNGKPVAVKPSGAHVAPVSAIASSRPATKGKGKARPAQEPTIGNMVGWNFAWKKAARDKR